MNPTETSPRIAVFGLDPAKEAKENHHPGLWSAGFDSSVTAAGGVPIEVGAPKGNQRWDDILEEVDGVLYIGFPEGTFRNMALEEDLCHWCRENKRPMLAIDNGLLMLNTAFSGTVYRHLPSEFPEALQHRHPPEEDVRHAINVIPNTHLANTYGEGEIIVNSQHRAAVQRIGKGFRVCALALDGVIEAIEWEDEDWFAIGVQWQPASATASGLDIQAFRTLVDAAAGRYVYKKSKPNRRARRAMAKAA